MALDPLVSLEVNRCIQCFLGRRIDAMSKPKAGRANGESQDEFCAFDDFDYDDPALNQMLGIEGDTSTEQTEGQAKLAQDLRFSEVCTGPSVGFRKGADTSPPDHQARHLASHLSPSVHHHST